MHINISNYKLATRIRVSDSCQMVWVIIITQLNCVCFKFDGYRKIKTKKLFCDKNQKVRLLSKRIGHYAIAECLTSYRKF